MPRGRPPKQATKPSPPLVTAPELPVVRKPIAQEKPVIVEGEKLADNVWEKIPLFLTVSYQSFIVALWSFRELVTSNQGLPDWMVWLYALFSACAGLSLDLVMIGTALRKDEKGVIHLLTLFAAWIASSAIAVSYFQGEWYVRLLHVTWSTMVLAFSWSLAEGKGANLSKKAKDLFWNAKR